MDKSQVEVMSAVSVKETYKCDSELPVNMYSNMTSRMKERKVLIIGDTRTRNCAANDETDIKDNFYIQRLVKPDAGNDLLMRSANKDMNLQKSRFYTQRRC
jgi:hypothetical protein